MILKPKNYIRKYLMKNYLYDLIKELKIYETEENDARDGHYFWWAFTAELVKPIEGHDIIFGKYLYEYYSDQKEILAIGQKLRELSGKLERPITYKRDT